MKANIKFATQKGDVIKTPKEYQSAKIIALTYAIWDNPNFSREDIKKIGRNLIKAAKER